MTEVKTKTEEKPKSKDGYYWCGKCEALIHLHNLAADAEVKCNVKECGNIEIVRARLQLGAEDKISENWVFISVFYSKRNNKSTINELRSRLNYQFSQHMGIDDFNLSLLQDLAALQSLAYIKSKNIKITITKS